MFNDKTYNESLLMGTYLATGIVHRMFIQKRHLEKRKFKLEDIAVALKKEVNMDHYFFGEDDDNIFWTINSKTLEGNLGEFLETQFKMYNDTRDIQKLIAQIKEAKTGEEVIDIAKNKPMSQFQMLEYSMGYIKVPYDNAFSDSLLVHYDLMAFFLDGKIIMECYGNIFRYFERNIRFQEEKYPIAGCVKVMISG